MEKNIIDAIDSAATGVVCVITGMAFFVIFVISVLLDANIMVPVASGVVALASLAVALYFGYKLSKVKVKDTL